MRLRRRLFAFFESARSRGEIRLESRALLREFLRVGFDGVAPRREFRSLALRHRDGVPQFRLATSRRRLLAFDRLFRLAKCLGARRQFVAKFPRRGGDVGGVASVFARRRQRRRRVQAIRRGGGGELARVFSRLLRLLLDRRRGLLRRREFVRHARRLFFPRLGGGDRGGEFAAIGFQRVRVERRRGVPPTKTLLRARDGVLARVDGTLAIRRRRLALRQRRLAIRQRRLAIRERRLAIL